jgi:hypothetical protein
VTIGPVIWNEQIPDSAMSDHSPAPLTYQDRLVAFVDVLGFASLVCRSADDADARARVGKLAATNRLFDAFFTKLMHRAKTAFFSDSFVVSMGPEEIIYLVREIGYLCRYLLLLGLPCRGGITCGPLHHEGRVVVGPAMVHAYLLERDEAKFPRVMLDDAAMTCWRAEFNDPPAHADCEVLVKTDAAGVSYLNLFNPKWSEAFLPWTEFIPARDTIPVDHIAFLKAATEQIEAGCKAALDEETRGKYEWLMTECKTASS